MKVLALYSIKGGVGKTAADLILVPVIPTTLSERTLSMLVDFFARHDLDRSKLLAFLSMVDRRKSLHARLADELPQAGQAAFCRTAIPISSDIEKMGPERRPVACFAPHSPGAASVQELWTEIRPLLST